MRRRRWRNSNEAMVRTMRLIHLPRSHAYVHESAAGGRIQVFEIGFDGLRSALRFAVIEDMNQGLSGQQAHRDHAKLVAIAGYFGLEDGLFPNAARQSGN